MWSRLWDTFFRGYEPLEVAVEIGVIWIVVWLVLRFLRGTRGAGAVRGFALVVALLALAVRLLSELSDADDSFGRLRFLTDRLLALLVIGLVVVFQPEIRQALARLGETRFLRRARGDASPLANEISEAVDFLSRSRFGAIIVIERSVPLGHLAVGGTELDAHVTAALLESIFWPNNPLHDLATVIRNGRIWSAGIQLPLAEEGSVPSHLGARHRAGLGITLDTDAVVVIVSEETGSVRIAHRGSMSAPVQRDKLKARLRILLEADTRPSASAPSDATDSSDAETQTSADGTPAPGAATPSLSHASSRRTP